MWAVLAHHVAPSTEYPACSSSISVSPRIVHWSIFVVELGEHIDPGDKLVYGVAEILTPTVGDEKDFIFKVEAAQINPSDLGTVGMLARFVADSIAVGESAFTVTVPFPQALEGMFKAVGDMKPVGNEDAGVVVAAGSAPEAQDLLGKRVAVTGGSSYAQYTKTSLNNPMFAVLLDDVSSLEGASVFVNSLEGAWFIINCNLSPLSEQQLVNYDTVDP